MNDPRSLPWLRLWTDFPNDYRVCSVTETMQARLVKLWCLHRRGLLVGAPVAQLAFELRLPAPDVEETLSVLTAAGLLLADRTPRGWDKRQRQYDDAAARMRDLRRSRQGDAASPLPSQTKKKMKKKNKRGDEQTPNECGTCSEHDPAALAEAGRDGSPAPAGSPRARTPRARKAKAGGQWPVQLFPSSPSHQLAKLLGDLIRTRDPEAKVPNPKVAADNRSFFEWDEEIVRLWRYDKRPWEEIERIIRWSQADDFWRGRILSPKKLRKHFTKLVAQADRSKPASAPAAAPELSVRDARAARLAREAHLAAEGVPR